MGKKRIGRITVDEAGNIIGSSIEHIRPGDTVIIEDREGRELYRGKFDPKRFRESLGLES